MTNGKARRPSVVMVERDHPARVKGWATIGFDGGKAGAVKFISKSFNES